MALIENTTFANCAPSGARSSISLRHIFSVWRSRRALAALDANALRDIGVSYKEAQTEANRVAWDVPQNWRC
ncbi:MAG: hypothetical protein ACI9PY_000937 [Ascidiaceihabitans sp.]|jgi:uncharacterized protein YjiS (DUF1127 family)